MQLCRELHDVSVPADLEQRLLQAIQLTSKQAKAAHPVAYSSPRATQGERAAHIAANPSQGVTEGFAPPIERRAAANKLSRRAWLGTGASAAAATLAWAAFSRRSMTEQEIIASVERALADEPWGSWQRISNYPQGVPISSQVLSPRRWQAIQSSLAPKTFLFDLTPIGRPTALMLVMPSPYALPEDLSNSPDRALQTSGGWSHIAVWQEASTLFALATQGTRQDFQFVVDTSGQVA